MCTLVHLASKRLRVHRYTRGRRRSGRGLLSEPMAVPAWLISVELFKGQLRSAMGMRAQMQCGTVKQSYIAWEIIQMHLLLVFQLSGN